MNETGKDAYKRRRSRVAFLDVRERPFLFKRLAVSNPHLLLPTLT